MSKEGGRGRRRLRMLIWLAIGFVLGTGLVIALLVGGCALLAGVGLVGAEAVLKSTDEDAEALRRKELEYEKALDADPKNWSDASVESMRFRDMEVKVSAVTVSGVADKGAFPRRRTLAVEISTRNCSASQVLRYSSWGGYRTTLDDGEGCKRGAEYRVSWEDNELQPGKSRTEELLFEEMEPRASTSELRLKLSLHEYGVQGHLRAKIPVSMVKKP